MEYMLTEPGEPMRPIIKAIENRGKAHKERIQNECFPFAGLTAS